MHDIPNKPLEMTFTPNTIEHLGVRMYSTLPPVLAELVANSQDADATEVHIYLNDVAKEIMVSDDGHGMTFDEINTKFLRIGRNRRNEDETEISPGGRKVIGKKGLGKLSFFGIAGEVEVQTTKNFIRNSFVMKWEDIVADQEKRDLQKNYSPTIKEYNVASATEKGTIVYLRHIKRITDFDENALADNLSRFFIMDPGFKIFIQRNNNKELELTNDRKYANLIKQIEWDVPKDIKLEDPYSKKDQVSGHLIATEKPIPPITNMKGITLFSRKKLVNMPEYFSDSTSSHFFTYLTGWLEVDFIDDLGEDVIGTNRQSLNWEHPEMDELRRYLHRILRWLETDWRNRRADLNQKKLEDKTGMKIHEWREHIPEQINKSLESVINALTKDAELPSEQAASSLKGLQEIIKPYPYFHWHNLHKTLHDLVFPYYKNEDYYNAVYQGVIKYKNEVQVKTGVSLTDRALLENVFSLTNPKLSVTKKYKKPDGTNFEVDTITNITQGHRELVIAMWQAFRCPIAHEAIEDLKNSGIYTEQDCLDALGLLSHLFYRLDNAETP